MQEFNQEDKQTTEIETNQSHVFSGLDKSRKIALAVLAFFALIVFAYGAYSIQQGIYAPFKPVNTSKQADTDAEVGAYCPDGNCADITDDDLKNKDTDIDGLTDYDEINIHKTSPYLEDSDSDGFLDKEEIDNNNDPNCPTGRECAGNVLVNGEADLTNPGVANNIDLEELNKQAEALNKNQATSTAGAVMDAATLRQALIDAGMDKAQLDQISDKDLMAEFESALAEQNTE
jgi:hypothetical protein